MTFPSRLYLDRNFPSPIALPLTALFSLIATLRNYDGDGNGNVKKQTNNGISEQKATLHVHHTFLYISLQSLHNNDVK